MHFMSWMAACLLLGVGFARVVTDVPNGGWVLMSGSLLAGACAIAEAIKARKAS